MLSVRPGFTGGASGKEPTCNAGDIRDMGLVPASGRSPGEGVATHSSILGWRIPMDRGAWWAAVHRVAKSQTRLKRLSMHACKHVQFCSFLELHFFNIWKGLEGIFTVYFC